MGNILEHCGHLSYVSSPTVARSPLGGCFRIRHVDSNIIPEFECVFPRATAATEAAVLHFCDEHRNTSFDFKIPDAGIGGGATLVCTVAGRPSIQRINAKTSTISVRIRRALLQD